MKIDIDPKLVKALERKTDEDIHGLVNRLLVDYLKGHFYGKKDIALRIKIEGSYRVRREEIADMYDEATQEFLGVVIVGESESQSIWVPSPIFHKMIEENDTVVVLKTPRKKGISVTEGEQVYAWLPEEEDVN